MKAKLTYLGAGIGLIVGFILYLISDYFIFVFLGPLVGFLSYDGRLYLQQKKQLEEQAKKAEAERLEKEQKRLLREQKKTQKKNREDKVSLYENIYSVAGYCLSTQQDLGVYIKNAEEVIAHFKVSSEVRAIAVEAFNRALDSSFDFESFVLSYKNNIGTNRDYMKYVLTYAYLIASVDGEINYEVKDRLVAIATAMGSTKAALKRLFQSKGAEARFAKEFDDDKSRPDSENTKREHSSSTHQNYNRSDVNSSRSYSSNRNSSYNQSSDNQSANGYSSNGSSANSGSSNSSSGGYSNSGSNKSNSSGASGSLDKTAQALGILGLDSNATFDDVKRAHKKMMFKYHPDRLAAQNLSPDMVAIYTDTAKSVQAAYDYLKKIYSDYI